MSKLIISKVCALILLACLRLMAGLIPLKIYRKLYKTRRHNADQEDDQLRLRRRHKMDIFLSVFLCFGAGLLLSTCFIHMLPEVSWQRADGLGTTTC